MLKNWICLALLLLLSAFSPPQEEDVLPGYWMDSWSQRAHMELKLEGETYTARIHWANSAFDFVQWDMSGTLEDGVISCGNCVKSLHSYDTETETQSVEILYENQPSELILENGVLRWTDIEGMGAECRFERVPDEAFTQEDG